MKIGVSTASLFTRQNTETAISTVKSLGAECAEVFLSTFYEYRPEFAKKYSPLAEGLELYSVHALSLNFEHQLFNPERRIRGDGFYWLDQVMRSAQLFGCKAYTFHGLNNNGGGTDAEWAAEYIGKIAEFCAGYNVKLCIENVWWCMYNNPYFFKKVKERCAGVSGVLDIKQARRSGYPYGMYINDMAGSISHVHLSDADENGKVCLPGEGVYDFSEIFRRLKDAGFNGNCFIEVYPDSFDKVEDLGRSMNYLKEIAYKLT